MKSRRIAFWFDILLGLLYLVLTVRNISVIVDGDNSPWRVVSLAMYSAATVAWLALAMLREYPR